MNVTRAETVSDVAHLPPIRIDSIRKNIVDAANAIEISQKEYPTKSPDCKTVDPSPAVALWLTSANTKTKKGVITHCLLLIILISSIRARS